MSGVPVRILAMMEAAFVTGPAKNLIGFGRWTRSGEALRTGLDLQLSVATFVRGSDTSNGFIDALRQAGIPVHLIRERRRFDPQVNRQLQAVVADVQPDILQTHNVKSHFLAKWAGLRNGRRWLAFQHGYTSTDLKMEVYNQLDRWSLRSADRVVTVCQAFVPKLLRYGVKERDVRVLHNSIAPAAPPTPEQNAALRKRWGVQGHESMLLAVGRLSQEKGHADLVDALGQLAQSAPALPWKLVLVGEGPELPALQSRAAALRITDRVVFAGFQSAGPYFPAANVFVLPSHSEGSPNVLLEAMAAKLPVVATAVGGVPEIATQEQTALLTPARDSRALAEALQQVLTDPALAARLAAQGYDRVCQTFSPAAYLQSLVSIYAEVLDLSSHAGLHHCSSL